jgi:peptidoglycan/LPS O-acetylase OafA/YrhL
MMLKQLFQSATASPNKIRDIQIWCIAGCSYLLIYFLLQSTAPFASVMKLKVMLENGGQVKVYYSNRTGGKNFSEKFSSTSKELKPGVRQDVAVRLSNGVLNSLRLDLGSSAGTIKLYNIRVLSPVAGKVRLDPHDIAERFVPGNENLLMEEKEKYVQIQAADDDPFIVCRFPVFTVPALLLYLVPALFSLAVAIALYRFGFKGVKSLLVSKGNLPSSGRNFQALDGLRGIAALMVVGDHCYGRFKGLGASGVWIFLVLSGFLLARPFISRPGLVTSGTHMMTFYAHRLRRILPMYYTYIVAVFLLTGHFDVAVRHFLFLEGSGHLWVIPQEIMFYLLAPLVFFIAGVVLRGNRLLGLLFTLGTAIAANKLLTVNVFSLYGMGNQRLRLFFGVFLFGVAAAYLFQLLSERQDALKRQIARFCSICGFTVLGFILVTSTAYLWGGTKVYAQMYFGWYGGLAALLVLCVALSDGTRLQRALAWRPFCSLGAVSLSFYLIHPLVINVLLNGSRHFLGVSLLGVPLLIATVLVSYLFSCLLYKGVEEPFFRKTT